MKEKVINSIKAEMAIQGIKQYELAKAIGCHRSRISKLIRGLNVNSHILWDVINYLNIKF